MIEKNKNLRSKKAALSPCKMYRNHHRLREKRPDKQLLMIINLFKNISKDLRPVNSNTLKILELKKGPSKVLIQEWSTMMMELEKAMAS